MPEHNDIKTPLSIHEPKKTLVSEQNMVDANTQAIENVNNVFINKTAIEELTKIIEQLEKDITWYESRTGPSERAHKTKVGIILALQTELKEITNALNLNREKCDFLQIQSVNR